MSDRRIALAGCLLALALAAPAPAQTAKQTAELRDLLRRALDLERKGRRAQAVKAWERALATSRRVSGPEHLGTLRIIERLGTLYFADGDYARAEPLWRRSLKLRQARRDKDKDRLSVAVASNRLAQLYQALGRYRKAEPLFKSTLATIEAELGKKHLEAAVALNNLAALYRLMARHARAESLYERSLEIRQAKLGKDHPDVAQSLNNLANLHESVGQYARAEPLYRRSLKIWEAKRGKDHPDVATALNNLAGLYESMGRHARAEPLYKRCLAIREAKLGKSHPDVAASLNNLAWLYKATGQYAKAEPLYKRSLDIWEAKLGKDHPDVATGLNNLAGLYEAMGEYGKAEPRYKRSLAIREGMLGGDHPDVGQSLHSLAILHAARKRWQEASDGFDRSRRITRHHVARVLPALSPREQAAFLEETAGGLEVALSLAWQRPDPALAARAAGWLVNGKAVAHEALAQTALLARDGNDPALRQLARQLKDVRQQLARATFTPPRRGQQKERSRQIDDLAGQEEQLAKKLRQAGSSAAPPDWLEPAALRKALPADGLLVDVARFRVWDFAGKRWQPARYVAWLTPPAGDVRRVDLGPADKVDAAVKDLRLALASAPALLKGKGEPAAEKALRAPLEALSKLVLHPLLKSAGGATAWVISPDGNLWLAPWQALTLPDGRYAIEKYRISYVNSGRDLLAPGAAKVKATAPLVLADPDFDGRRTGGRPRKPRRGKEPPPGLRSLGLDSRKVARLRYSAAEAKAIGPSLKKYAGAAPRVYTGTKAVEGVFKSARNPRVVVFSTHGFFLPDRQRKAEGKVARWENPLLRCGLLLAGCNRAGKAKGGEDGVLTGLEVVGTDLRGCALVVLSACATGLGKVQAGEGVSGLRQAFQLAGARAVVSTLWQVPDRASAELMASFFAGLAAGKGKAEALRAAQLGQIAARRADRAAAHPFFWAAFTLTGDPGK
jgi:CHAT domain-containing protein/tetratricopeptide (TPR) repeat protein